MRSKLGVLVLEDRGWGSHLKGVEGDQSPLKWKDIQRLKGCWVR